MTRPARETLIFSALLLVISAVACASGWAGYSTWLEVASFITGAVCVWLTVKESVWNFPIGLVNSATFLVVFFESHLFADAGLQIVYFVLTALGWYMWLKGGEGRTELRISRSSPRELAITVGVVAVVTIALWQLLQRVGGSASFWDALTTSISLGAQWQLNKKRLESWVFWIVVDVIYIPLYLYKALYLTALLYLAFLIMAVMGLGRWRQTHAAERALGAGAAA
jgi:nicotinamide mononucleotide transporter